MTPETMERIDALLAGTLDPAGFRELQEEMRRDPAVVDYYCGQAEMHGRLEWELGEPAHTMLQGRSRVAPPSPHRIAFPRRLMLAAALVACAAGLVLFSRSLRDPGVAGVATPPAVDEPPEYVARITRGEGARWSGASTPAGDWLRPGVVQLREGSAEITFDSGATVILESGARLDISSPTRARLDRGKATVGIPDSSDDFVFETPSTQLSQQGTRFGVVVDPGGETEIHVLDGRVALNGKWGQLHSLMLEKDRPIRIDPAGALLASRRYSASSFPAHLPASQALLPPWFMHWSFDRASTAPDTFSDSGRKPPGMPSFPARVRLAEEDASVGLIAGKYGNAVQFNGRDGFLATDFPGIEGAAARSIAFWIRLPENASDTYAYSILSWGSPAGGEKWQLGWNGGSDNRGVRGAIRTEVGLGYHVGSTDLRDGQWHHVASIFLGGKGARSGSHIRHYVDGRLQSTTAVGDRVVDTRIHGPQALPVSIGRRIESDRYHRTFLGDLDEVYLFPVALTPEQVWELYRTNTPPEIRAAASGK